MALSDFWKLITGSKEETSGSDAEPKKDPESPSEESATEPEPPTERRYLTIGLDWGTSATKVVIRDPYGPGSPAYLVNFGRHGAEEDSHLLPSALSVNDEGRVLFGGNRDGTSVTELKVHLMQQQRASLPVTVDAEPRELAALYIAAVLRYARHWLMEKHGDRYRGYDLIWEFNLGIPAATHDDEDVRTLFRELAQVGWGISRQDGMKVLDARNAYDALAEGDFEPGIHEDLVSVIPEVAAQVAGYARSSLRRPGLHVLVDVGASTLDLAGFMLTEQEGEDRYGILAAGVYSLGAFELERERLPGLKALGRDIINPDVHEEWADDMAQRCQDPMRKVPPIRGYFPESVRDDIGWSDIEDIDSAFRQDCYTTIRALIADLRNDRAPRGRRWEEGLPIFLAGGGRDIEVYLDALEDVDHWRRDYLTAAPFDIRGLPSLEDLTAPNLDSAHEHRFSVAYGLSYPAGDIGEIKPPHEIPDLDLDSDNQSSDVTDYRDRRAWT